MYIQTKLIAIDLYQANYQTLLIIYQEVTINNAYIAEKKKIKVQCRIIGFKYDRLNYKCEVWRKGCAKLINEAVNNFQILYRFCKSDLNKFFCC